MQLLGADEDQDALVDKGTRWQVWPPQHPSAVNGSVQIRGVSVNGNRFSRVENL